MSEGESLDGYLAKFFATVNNLKSLGEDVSETRIVQKLLMSLSRRYKSIVSIIEETRDLDVLRAEEVIASVKVYDKREDLHDERDKLTGTEKAFSSLKVGNNQAYSSHKGFQGRSTQKWQSQDRRGSNWTPNRNLNSYNNSSWNNTVEGSSQAGVKPQCQVCQKHHHGLCRHKGKPRCGRCNQFGHIAKDCDSHSHKQLANYAKEEGVTTGTMFYACHSASLQVCKT
jgi:hypothetical protein